jgi:anti-sigma-K factor RskA
MTDVHALSAAYALDALDESATAEFAGHLASCDFCRVDVREMRETAAALAVSVRAQPTAELRTRVLETVRHTPQSTGPAVSLDDYRRHRERSSRVNRLLAGVAAAALVIAGALGVSVLKADQRADDTQLASDQLVSLLGEPGTTVHHGESTAGGSGSLVVSEDKSEAIFLADDLANPGDNKTYQLWAMGDNGATSLDLISHGTSDSDVLSMPPGTAAFGMTVEPSGGSPQPTSDPVLLVKLPA